MVTQTGSRVEAHSMVDSDGERGRLIECEIHVERSGIGIPGDSHGRVGIDLGQDGL